MGRTAGRQGSEIPQEAVPGGGNGRKQQELAPDSADKLFRSVFLHWWPIP